MLAFQTSLFLPTLTGRSSSSSSRNERSVNGLQLNKHQHGRFCFSPLPFIVTTHQRRSDSHGYHTTLPYSTTALLRHSASVTASPRAAEASAGPLLPPPYRHFLHVDDLSTDEILVVLREAQRLKASNALNDPSFHPLLGKAMSMVFAKPSARTRVSFETAMYKSGGHALCLGPEVGVNTRERAKDIARVLSGMTDMIMARLFGHDDLIELAEYASVPVINGLTDYNHPCQIMADALTMMEHYTPSSSSGSTPLDGVKVVYVGDGNNIVHSWLELAARIPELQFTCCCPKGYEPDMQLFERVKSEWNDNVALSHDPMTAVQGAHFVYTDVWASMGQKEEVDQRVRDFAGFQVNEQLMANTKASGNENGAKFLHCLPAERGRECTDEVVEAEYSLVFEQAENRMHAQLGIMLHCMGVLQV